MDFVTRNAVANDLTYIDYLQRKNAEELAFFPKQVFEREVENHRLILAELNNEPCGYIYHGAFGVICRIHQACIQYDLRGQLYGAALVKDLVARCEASETSTIKLRCGSDIQANDFWKAMGFTCEGITQGGVRRMRDINHWVLNIQPQLFFFGTEPSNKKKDASFWRKRGDISGNSAHRGKALKEYRTKILSKEADQ